MYFRVLYFLLSVKCVIFTTQVKEEMVKAKINLNLYANKTNKQPTNKELRCANRRERRALRTIEEDEGKLCVYLYTLHKKSNDFVNLFFKAIFLHKIGTFTFHNNIISMT